jgi:AMP nucleosidase
LCEAFQSLATEKPAGRYRAFYPQISLETTSFGMVDSRLSYGHVVSPGRYAHHHPAFAVPHLPETQIELLMRNHDTPLKCRNRKPRSRCISPLEGAYVEAGRRRKLDMPLRDTVRHARSCHHQ